MRRWLALTVFALPVGIDQEKGTKNMNISGMTMRQAMGLYGANDRDHFESCLVNYSERPRTLFYADFKIAEVYGIKAVWDTFRNCGNLATRDPKEVCELAMTLNHLLWGAYERKAEKLYKYYMGKYQFITDEIIPQWSDEDRRYYRALTD